MRLALDTAFSACSAALADDAGAVKAEDHKEQRRGQAETLVPMVEGVLKAAGLTLKDVDEIVVNTGPGTFAGVRIATAFARAAALATGARILGVNAFEALAAALVLGGKAKKGELILGLIPGKRGEISAALLRAAGHGAVLEKGPETMPFSGLAAFAGKENLIVAGPDLDQSQAAFAPLSPKATFSFWPSARELIEISKNREQSEFLPTVSPFYLRPPDAKAQKPPPFAARHGRNPSDHY